MKTISPVFPTTITSYTPLSNADVLVGPDQLNYNGTIAVVSNDCINDNAFRNLINSGSKANQVKLSNATLSFRSVVSGASFILYNSVGQRIMEGKIDGGYTEKSFTNYPDGIYILQLKDPANRKVETIRLIHN